MENTFPTLLERDDINEDVAKWIQFTMNEINKYKIDLPKCDTSTKSGEDLAHWHLQSIESGILLKIHKWFTDNGYNVGQFCHDGLTIERNKYNHYPDM